MAQAIEGVTAVQVVTPYVLKATFEDGVQGYVEVESYLHGEMFAPLRTPAGSRR
ncbi:MAG TPA: hypothetical protein VII06_15445 [Chloroflexota bacterium]|jgi:hypothetical protein